MNRNRGIAAVIFGILISGILFTSFTVRLVGRQTGEQETGVAARYASGPAGEQGRAYPSPGEAGMRAALPESEEETGTQGPVLYSGITAQAEETAAAQAAADAAAEPDAAALEASGENTEEASLAADEAAGPGVMLEEAVGGTVLSEDRKTAEDFRRRLEEIDSQIADQRSRNEAVTTYDMWTMAENERKLWDSELNNIYSNIRSHIPEDRVEALIREERAWIVERDAQAAEAAGKYAGGSLESVEYAASLAACTRDRAYELVETYGEYLR